MTTRSGAVRPAPNLVERQFRAEAPNRLSVTDATDISTWAGFLVLAIVLDVFSRKVLAWAIATQLRTEFMLETLERVLGQHRPESVIHHSDQGSFAFALRYQQAGVRSSMGSMGGAYDDAMAESFLTTLECDLLDPRRFRTPAEAKLLLFESIEGWYNPRRQHSSLGYRWPNEFERMHKAALR